jgi:hypothetical protein
LLASLDTQRWFPAAWVQWAWVIFDLSLCAALLVLGRGFRPWLSRAIGVAIAVDLCLTLVQAFLFNLGRLHRLSDALGVALAVAAPAVASLILRNAHQRACRASGINV